LKIGNRFLELIHGFILSLYFVEVENLLEMEYIGRRFKVNKNLLKNKQLKHKNSKRLWAIIQVKIISQIKEQLILQQKQINNLY